MKVFIIWEIDIDNIYPSRLHSVYLDGVTATDAVGRLNANNPESEFFIREVRVIT